MHNKVEFWDDQSINSYFGEIWRPISGYEGVYMVSSFGRVKRLVGYACLKDRILKQSSFGIGYKRVTLSVNDVKKISPVHVLVAKNFIPNENDYPIVMHNDDNPSNNCLFNLKWGTQKQNIQECHKKGRASNNLPKLSGKNHPMYGKKPSYETLKKASDSKKKITNEQIIMAKELVKLGLSQKDAAAKSGFSSAYLSQLLNGYNRY